MANNYYNGMGGEGFAQGPLTRNPRQGEVPRQAHPLQHGPCHISQANQMYGQGLSNGAGRQAHIHQHQNHQVRVETPQAFHHNQPGPSNGAMRQAHYPIRVETPQFYHHNQPGPSNEIRRQAPPPYHHAHGHPTMAQNNQMNANYRQAGPSHQQQFVDEEVYGQGPMVPTTSRPDHSMLQPMLPQRPSQHHHRQHQQQQAPGQGTTKNAYLEEYERNQKKAREAEARREAKKLREKEEAERKAVEARKKREEEKQKLKREQEAFQRKFHSPGVNSVWIFGDNNYPSTSAAQNVPVFSEDCFQVAGAEEVVGDGPEAQHETNRQFRDHEMTPSSNSGEISELDMINLFVADHRRQRTSESDEDDTELLKQIKASLSQCSGTEEDIVQGLKQFEEKMNEALASATSVQPPSISPTSTQRLSTEGTRPVPPNQENTSPQAPPSLASTSGTTGTYGTAATPQTHVTPPNPQVFQDMQFPAFPPPPLQMPQPQGQHFLNPADPGFFPVEHLMKENYHLRILVRENILNFNVLIGQKDEIIRYLSQRLATAEARLRRHGDLIEDVIPNKRKKEAAVKIKVEPEEEEEEEQVDVNSAAVQEEAAVALLRRRIKNEIRAQNPPIQHQKVEGITVTNDIPPENRRFGSFGEAVACWREKFPPQYFEMKLRSKGIINLGFTIPQSKYFFNPQDPRQSLPQLVVQPSLYAKLNYKNLAANDPQIPPWRKGSDVLWKTIMAVVGDIQREQSRAGLIHWTERKESTGKKRGRPVNS